jgi:tRNA(Ile)-lysidine synthase
VPGGDAAPGAPVVGRVRAAVATALAECGPVVLAVSGGRDSVVLFDAVLAAAPAAVRLVATYNHGTGPAAAAALRHVRALARAAGAPVYAGRARGAPAATEAGWRDARWRFLRRAARRAGAGATVATGHTADDQLETVVMRLLRGAGARGLAAMYAPQPGIVRPLLAVSRAEVAAYAAARGLAWVDDPANGSRRHLRNRVRHDLLPALLRARPTLGAELLDAAARAAACRAALDDVAAAIVGLRVAPGDGLAGPGGEQWRDGVPIARLAALVDLSAEALLAVWPALAARAGVRRLAAFTRQCVAAAHQGRPPAGGATVAGGVHVTVERGAAMGSPEWAMVARRAPPHRAPGGGAPAVPDAAAVALDPGAPRGVRLGRWRLRVLGRAPTAAELDAGRAAWLPAGRRYEVRGWRPGDRWRPADAGAARRVKRFLADRRVPAVARAGWPVVVEATSPGDAPAARGASGGQIAWVPGVRRSSAAPARPGQPGFFLLCDRIPERPARR